ncbi:cilium assembly protein DZIP1L-like [Desmodus rotundus]|uniref:cilium assembly protein DZIP1L-like n=1 Tax=Desmodus rotundus TaxID=9430 RepID=UPI002380CCA6|nr:cilium assembly protein DZIP1L-like [Desmodus rotundus]
MDPTESQKQEESKEEVVRDLRAQLTSTQEELTALLEKQRQLQEAKTTCQRERDAKAMFEEWKEELSEEINQQKKVFWDELKSSVLPDSPLEEKPAAPQSRSAVCSNLGALQDVECEELLRQTQELQALRILKKAKIQERELKRTFHELEEELASNNKELQDENQELRKENKMLRREKNKLQKEKEKIEKENEMLKIENEKLQTENPDLITQEGEG